VPSEEFFIFRPDFRKVSEILEELDRLVLRFRRTGSGTRFAEAWQAARPRLRPPPSDSDDSSVPPFERRMVFPMLESSSINDGNRCFEAPTANENAPGNRQLPFGHRGNQASVTIFLIQSLQVTCAV
jgi:hypothetical protein